MVKKMLQGCIGIGVLMLLAGCGNAPADADRSGRAGNTGRSGISMERDAEAVEGKGGASAEEREPGATGEAAAAPAEETEGDIFAEPEGEASGREDGRGVGENLTGEDEEFYVSCLQNLQEGNSMVYADGYYYFRSQVMDYSLCRSEGAGMPVEVVADQIPGAIYVRGNTVYFINVSDGRTLYRVGTDGSGLTKLADFPMQELLVVGDTVYFRSVYDREYDPFYQLVEEEAEDDRYLYSMKLDGSGCKLLVPKVCREFVTDGNLLYYLIYEEGGKWVLYQNCLDGTEEEKLAETEGIWSLLCYRGDLYWIRSGDRALVRLDAQGKQEALAYDVQRFLLSGGWVYAIDEKAIRRVNPGTGEEFPVTEREADEEGDYNPGDIWPWYVGSYNRGIFLVNGKLFGRYFESGEKGVLWHIWDEEKGEFVVFEDMEPLDENGLVCDSSLTNGHGELLFYEPGGEDERAAKYLDGEFEDEDAYGLTEDGEPYGKFSIFLPKFNSSLEGYKQLNLQMETLMELAMEDKEDFFLEIEEYTQAQDYGQGCYGWFLAHGYSHLYVGEKYVSMFYYRGGYDGGFRLWQQSLPLIFDRGTGLKISMDELFTVDRNFYMKRLTTAVYKYCEMEGCDWWNEAFDNNVLVKNFGSLGCYLTPDGIVLCYERYAVQPGASGNPNFEIPYERFADIFR